MSVSYPQGVRMGYVIEVSTPGFKGTISSMARRIDDILEDLRSLSREERSQLSQQLRRELDEESPSRANAFDPRDVLGLFANEADLIDEVCESAMQSREQDPLRLAND